MRRRFRYFRLFGLMTVLFLGISAFYWGTRGKNLKPSPLRTASPPTQRYTLVVAAQDLYPYTLLTQEMVRVRATGVAPPKGTFATPKEVAGRLTRTLIRAGEPLFESQLTPPLPDTSVSTILPPGMVGIALPIARREQLPPVRVGDGVRIYAVFARTKVKPVAMRALVLSPGMPGQETKATGTPSEAAAPINELPSLLVAVTPEEARAIALALDSGATLFYAALPPLPFSPQYERSLTLNELAGLPSPQTPSPQPAPSTPSPRSNPSPPSKPPSPVLPAPVVVPPSQRQPPRLSPPQATNQPKQPSSPPMRQIIGVVGDRAVVFSVPMDRERGSVP